MKNNPFPYTYDNKRYHTYNYFTQEHYGQKVFKVCIDAGFTCPNRDGTVTTGGCVFCSERGSGDIILQTEDIEKQIEHGFALMRKKWPNAKAIAYFQSYTNTHASLDELKRLYTPFFFDDRFVSIDIATRSDCLDARKIEWFKEMSQYKEVTFEIGLQSVHHQTATWMNRGHGLQSVTNVINLLKSQDLSVCIHIINGFPNETVEMLLETAQYCADMNPDMIKIHMLHILKNTPLGDQYEKQPFSLLTRDEYVELIVRQLELLPPEMVVARLTGDGIADDLLTPDWTQKKTIVLNEIDKLMKLEDTFQGKKYKRKEL